MRLRTDPAYRAILKRDVPTDEVLREDGRQLCKTNLLCLCYVLGYTRIDPVIHKEALEWFIPRDLTKPVSEQGKGYPLKGTLLYPRGTFKTTIDEADTVQELICFPLDCSVGVICANTKLADALVANIAAHFTKAKHALPTLFQALFPELLITPSQVEGGVFSTALRQTEPPIKEAALMAFSVESGVSGWHFWRVKGDDIANNRNMKTEASQAEVWRNYTTSRKTLNPGGIEDKLGTRYGPNDPYGMELKNSRPGSYRYVSKPALRLLSGERLDANGFPPPEDIELLFEPLGLTYDKLREEYEMDYSSFMQQYMNDAFGDAEITFTEEMILAIQKPAEDMPLHGEMHLHWRLPNRANGWTHAAAAVGILEKGRMFVVEVKHGSYRPSRLAREIVTLAKKHDTTAVSIEDSPGARLLEAPILNYALTQGYTLHVQWTEPYGDAAERDLTIKSLEPLMTAGRLILQENLSLSKRIFEQFTNYGMIADDGVPDVIARLCGALPVSILRSAPKAEDDIARRMAVERDHFNMLYGQGAYAHREPEPEAEPEPQEEPSWGSAYGLEDIMPGLNG